MQSIIFQHFICKVINCQCISFELYGGVNFLLKVVKFKWVSVFFVSDTNLILNTLHIYMYYSDDYDLLHWVSGLLLLLTVCTMIHKVVTCCCSVCSISLHLSWSLRLLFRTWFKNHSLASKVTGQKFGENPSLQRFFWWTKTLIIMLLYKLTEWGRVWRFSKIILKDSKWIRAAVYKFLILQSL